MNCLSSFYTVVSSHSDSESATYSIRLNPDHFIFAAHFPGNPIVPGVCQVGIVEELASDYIGHRLQTASIGNIKYMNIITPQPSSHIGESGQMVNVPLGPSGRLPQQECSMFNGIEVTLSRITRGDDGIISLQAVMRNATTTFTKMSIKLARK